MPTSDEELAAKQESVEALRQEVLDTRNDNATEAALKNNDVFMAQLEAEEASLQRQLTYEQNISEGKTPVEAMQEAAEQEEAANPAPPPEETPPAQAPPEEAPPAGDGGSI